MKFNLKVKPETLVTVGLGILGVAQMVLTNKKDQTDRANLKAEVVKEIMEQQSLKKD